MSRRLRSDRRAGFTLIETLAAFAILSIALIALFVGASGAIRSEARTRFELAALRLARTRLEEAGIVSPLSPGVSRGRSGTFSWTMKTWSYAPNGVGAGEPHASWMQIFVRPRGAPRPVVSLLTLKTITDPSRRLHETLQ